MADEQIYNYSTILSSLFLAHIICYLSATIVLTLGAYLLCSALDDVILDYVVEVLTNLGDADENSFDVDQLHEMIAAYVPEFTQVDRCETRIMCVIFNIIIKLQLV